MTLFNHFSATCNAEFSNVRVIALEEFWVPRKKATVTSPVPRRFGWGTHRPWWPECWRRTWRMSGPSWKEKSCSWAPTRRTCWLLKLWAASAPGTRRWRSSGSETPASTPPVRAAAFPPPAARWWRKSELRTADRWHKTPRSPWAAAMTSLKNSCRPSVVVSHPLIALLWACVSSSLRFLCLFLLFVLGAVLVELEALVANATSSHRRVCSGLVDLKVLQWILDPGKSWSPKLWLPSRFKYSDFSLLSHQWRWMKLSQTWLCCGKWSLFVLLVVICNWFLLY